MANYADDRRHEERFATPPHVECAFASPVLEDFGRIKVTSISRTGIGLLAAEALAPGMLLSVKLVNPTRDFAKNLLVRVVHVTQQKGAAFLVGGTLDSPLTYEEICALTM